jgi:acyl dehydratase
VVTVTDKRTTRKADRGVVTLQLDVHNQRSEVVQVGTAKVLVRRKETS